MSSFTDKMMHVRTVVRSMGPWTAALYALAQFFRRFLPFMGLGKYHLVSRPVTRQRLLAEGRGTDITLRRITRPEPLIAQLHRPDDEIARRFAGGAVCLLATRNDQIVGHLWVTLTPYREPVHRCEFSPQPPGRAAWEFDFWIAESERLGFTFARLWDECNRYLSEKGIDNVCSCVSAFNLAAVRAHQRLGMEVLHTLYFLCAGQVELLLASVAPRVALSFSRNRFPLVKVFPPQSAPASAAIKHA